MEESTPLLAGEAPPDPSVPPSYPAAVDAEAKNQDALASAGKKEEQKFLVPRWTVGRSGATEAGEGSSSGGINARSQGHAVDVYKGSSPPSPATTTPGGTPSPPSAATTALGGTPSPPPAATTALGGTPSHPSPTTTAAGRTTSPPPPATTTPGGTPSPPSTVTSSPGGTGAEPRRGFLFWVRSSLLGREGWERGDRVLTLIQCAQDFAGRCSGHCVLADPAAEMTEALQKFAAAPNVATAASVGVAATALAKTAGGEKLEQDHARVAKLIASEARALATCGPGANRSRESPCSRSPEVLFYIAIPSSLGLLPYLSTTIPKNLQSWVGYLFGAVFSAATVGAVLLARGRDNTDMEMASIVGAVCFTAFSLLVIVFVSCALVGGDIALICILAVIIALVHIWVWARR